MKNEILHEVWKNRDAFARQCNYNLDEMIRTLQATEKTSPAKVVDRRKLTQVKSSGKDSKTGMDH